MYSNSGGPVFWWPWNMKLISPATTLSFKNSWTLSGNTTKKQTNVRMYRTYRQLRNTFVPVPYQCNSTSTYCIIRPHQTSLCHTGSKLLYPQKQLGATAQSLPSASSGFIIRISSRIRWPQRKESPDSARSAFLPLQNFIVPWAFNFQHKTDWKQTAITYERKPYGTAVMMKFRDVNIAVFLLSLVSLSVA